MGLQHKAVGGDLRLEYDLEDGWVMILDKDGEDLPGVLISTVVLDRLIVALGELRQVEPVSLIGLISQARQEAVQAHIAQPGNERLGRVVNLLGQAAEAMERPPVNMSAVLGADMVWLADDL